ncbi:MAG: ribose-phosphate diphosphokinase, partial [Candidatus Micrarchaeaceae archaeon]
MSQAYSIIYDSASYDLANGMAKDLGLGLDGMVEIIRTAFKDGEFKLRFSNEVKADEAVLVMRMYPNVNDNVVALMFALSKLKSMGKSIRVVLPYLAYARQDKEFLSGEVASIYVIGDMMAHYGVKELITIDVHSHDILGRLGVRVTNLSASSMLSEYLNNSGGLSNPLVISPDEGSIERS